MIFRHANRVPESPATSYTPNCGCYLCTVPDRRREIDHKTIVAELMDEE